jgi:hypothetical protein
LTLDVPAIVATASAYSLSRRNCHAVVHMAATRPTHEI